MLFDTSKTKEQIPEELQLFDSPTIMSSISDAYTMDIFPVNQSADSEVLEFIITPSENFISPSECILYLKCAIESTNKFFSSTTTTTTTPVTQPPPASSSTAGQITTTTTNTTAAPAAGSGDDADPALTRALAAGAALKAGQTPTASDDAAPVNALFYAIFDRCDVELNGAPLDFGFKEYGYKAYFNILLSHTKEMKKTVLRNAFWIPDTTGRYDDIRYDDSGANLGLVTRYKLTQKSKPFEMTGPIMHELFLQTQYLPPGVQIRIKLHRKIPSFYLISKDISPSYRLKIQDARLITKFVRVAPPFYKEIEKTLASKPAIYTIYDATDIKTRQIQKGLTSYSIDNFFAGEKLSNRLVFALVDQFAFSGNYRQNPFYFQTFGLEEITLSVDNQTYSYKSTSRTRTTCFCTTQSLLSPVIATAASALV